ncbi:MULTISPECIES: toll/interleukin-1 receptor domain-containing protein [unclassified Kitasatospora]|uniref:toll/interleukin-1 receptor domain-containing protein n=1 Tax=unclassified Kitasatospora TaxID=2633591 RepID=UPI003437A0D0
MPDIFINYRTGDEEGTATLLERELSRRFGSDRVFRASKSIEAGQKFPQALITAVRRSSVLLPVIGLRWMEASSADGSRALDNPEDWTRREIIEAFESGALIVPVLVDRAPRLKRADLPLVLSGLADHQYRRLDLRNAEADLTRIGNDLAALVPQLAAADRLGVGHDQRRLDDTDDGEIRSAGIQIRAREIRSRQRGGIGNLTGGFSGTFVSEPSGPVHTGSGHQYTAPRFSGDGMGVNYIAGKHSGTVRTNIDNSRCPEDGDR